MSLLRQNKIQDGTDSTRLAEVNSLGELRVTDPSLITVQNSALTKLTEIDTAIDGIATTQTDKSQS